MFILTPGGDVVPGSTWVGLVKANESSWIGMLKKQENSPKGYANQLWSELTQLESWFRCLKKGISPKLPYTHL